MVEDRTTDESNTGPAGQSLLQRLTAEALLATALLAGGTTGCGVGVTYHDKKPGSPATQTHTPPPPPTSPSSNTDAAPSAIEDEALNFLNQLRSDPPESEIVNEEMKALLVAIRDTQALNQRYYNARIDWLETMKGAPRELEEEKRRERLLQAERESGDTLAEMYRLWNIIKPGHPLSLEQARAIAGDQRNARAIPSLLTQAEADGIRLEEERRLGELYRKYPDIGIGVSQQLQAEHARADAAIDQIIAKGARRLLGELVGGANIKLTQNELLLLTEAALIALHNQAGAIKAQTQETYINGHPFTVPEPEQDDAPAPASRPPAPAQNGNAAPSAPTETPAVQEATTDAAANRARQERIKQNRKSIEAITNSRNGPER